MRIAFSSSLSRLYNPKSNRIDDPRRVRTRIIICIMKRHIVGESSVTKKNIAQFIRALPKGAKKPRVLIIGSGIAGLSLALRLSKDHKIVLITKGGVNECSTSWAQGGIASVTSKTDSYDKHLIDTIDNGHEIVDQQVASRIIKDGPNCIKWLDEKSVISGTMDTYMDT